MKRRRPSRRRLESVAIGGMHRCPRRPMTRQIFSRKSCAARCRATRSMRTMWRSPSWTSCRAPTAMCWCCPNPRRAIFSTPIPRCSASSSPACKKSRLAVKEALAADGITILQYNEPAGGQIVFHLHFHILPRWKDVELRPHTGALEKPEVLEAFRGKNRGGDQTRLIDKPGRACSKIDPPRAAVQCFRSGSSTVLASSSSGMSSSSRSSSSSPPSPLRRRDLARRTSGSGRTRFLLASTMSRSGRGRTGPSG